MPRRFSVSSTAYWHPSGAPRSATANSRPTLASSFSLRAVHMTRAPRSPGSTLKPLIYGLAFERGLAWLAAQQETTGDGSFPAAGARQNVPVPVAALAEGIRQSAAAGEVADPANLADDRVWLFHGTLDETIAAQVHDSAASLYAEFIPTDQIEQVNDVPAGHFFPSDDSGHACNEMKEPYVGDCDYDAAGELLKFLYPGLVEPTVEIDAELLAVTLPGADDADLLETAYLYIPKACVGSDNACALHLVLHGCAQSADTIGTAFIEQSGYLEWADANDIVLAFPQVEKSVVAPLNPHACWDWWGYTGPDYRWREGKQMRFLTAWLERLRS